VHFASNLRAGRLLARGMCMGCCTPEAPEHERFGRPPVPCIKGRFSAYQLHAVVNATTNFSLTG